MPCDAQAGTALALEGSAKPALGPLVSVARGLGEALTATHLLCAGAVGSTASLGVDKSVSFSLCLQVPDPK